MLNRLKTEAFTQFKGRSLRYIVTYRISKNEYEEDIFDVDDAGVVERQCPECCR